MKHTQGKSEQKEAQLQVFAARLVLHHITCGAHCLGMLVGLGTLHVESNPDFFSETIRRSIPKLQNSDLTDVGELLKESTLEDGRQASKAAQLIFVHSGCEAALEKLCEAIAGYKPELWYAMLKERRVTLADAAGEWRQNLGRVLTLFLEELKKESLIVKTQRLFAVLQPASARRRGFTFSESRLQEIDQKRHMCAHGKYHKECFATLEEDIKFLIEAAEFFIDETERKLGLASEADQERIRALQNTVFGK